MRHYLTYQHNVQKLFRDHRDKYDGVIIPLSIATSFPSGTFGFIRALCANGENKQYAIDPRNALFQKHWNRANVRAPHEKMAGALGLIYVRAGLSRALEPSDFTDELSLDEHVRQTIEIQLCFRSRTEDARKLEKYKKLLGLKTLGELGMPQFLIPPYYQFSSVQDPWFAISKRCIVAAMRHANGVPVWPVLHFDEWQGKDWVSVHNWLRNLGANDFWYYPNNFKEHDASINSLQTYRDTVAAGIETGLVPRALFGGYFAILLSYYGLAGYSNGIGYGEWRDSGYHRGGSAATRIYMLKLHRYVDVSTAQHLVESDPEYFGGDSEITAGYVEAGDSLVDITVAEALDHFMECRRQELDFVDENNLESAMAELEETEARLKSIGSLEYERYGQSITRWKESLS